jgi:hypothetical protein
MQHLTQKHTTITQTAIWYLFFNEAYFINDKAEVKNDSYSKWLLVWHDDIFWHKA